MACETQLKKKQGRKEVLKARFEILYLNEDGKKSLHVLLEEYVSRATSLLEDGLWFKKDDGEWVGIPTHRILIIRYWPIAN